MKEFKGTRGKWNVELKTEMISIHTGENSQDVDRGNGVWHDPNICGIWAHVDYEERHTCEANGQLIAAAPDLLDACQQLMECYENKGQLLSFDVDTVRQALNKALV